jgi:hypothetical protein
MSEKKILLYGILPPPASLPKTIIPMKRNTYTSETKAISPSWFITTLVCLCIVFINTRASAQHIVANKTIKGIVKFQEDDEAAPGVNIYLKGSTAHGTVSDGKGQFEFPQLLKTGDVLIFSFIGRKTTEYVVSDQSNAFVEIILGPEYIEMVELALVEGEPSSRSTVLARVFRKSRISR